ncbi:MAG: Acyltransferase 3 [Sphingomonadales bacterium]|nr:Acyltransferase 3 [Sphingomonadales bacterium]
MKSSEGMHFVGLDHIRALAVFMVVSYHFLQGTNHGVHTGSTSFIGNALFMEGQTGVGLFMTLSGYLLVRLANGRDLMYWQFLFNRSLRLLPLLFIVLGIYLVPYIYLYPMSAGQGLLDIASGIIFPIWPNGAWSISTEFHFYVVFPLLLIMARRNPLNLIVVPAIAIAVRVGIFVIWDAQHVQDAAYWTIIGRIDEFALGMLFARYSHWFAGRHFIGAATGIIWVALWYAFVQAGGIHDVGHQWIWIGLTTVEGLFYAVLIAYYDRSFTMPDTGISGAIAKIGGYSYGIYLLHFFIIGKSSRWIESHVTTLDNFYLTLLLTVPPFLITAALARLSYRCIELPFLRFRTPYFRTAKVRAELEVTAQPQKIYISV